MGDTTMNLYPYINWKTFWKIFRINCFVEDEGLFINSFTLRSINYPFKNRNYGIDWWNACIFIIPKQALEQNMKYFTLILSLPRQFDCECYITVWSWMTPLSVIKDKDKINTKRWICKYGSRIWDNLI